MALALPKSSPIEPGVAPLVKKAARAIQEKNPHIQKALSESINHSQLGGPGMSEVQKSMEAVAVEMIKEAGNELAANTDFEELAQGIILNQLARAVAANDNQETLQEGAQQALNNFGQIPEEDILGNNQEAANDDKEIIPENPDAEQETPVDGDTSNNTPGAQNQPRQKSAPEEEQEPTTPEAEKKQEGPEAPTDNQKATEEPKPEVPPNENSAQDQTPGTQTPPETEPKPQQNEKGRADAGGEQKNNPEPSQETPEQNQEQAQESQPEKNEDKGEKENEDEQEPEDKNEETPPQEEENPNEGQQKPEEEERQLIPTDEYGRPAEKKPANGQTAAPQQPESDEENNGEQPPQPNTTGVDPGANQANRGTITRGINFIRNRKKINALEKEIKALNKEKKRISKDIKRLNAIIRPLELERGFWIAIDWLLWGISWLIILTSILFAIVTLFLLLPIAGIIYGFSNYVDELDLVVKEIIKNLDKRIREFKKKRDQRQRQLKERSKEIKKKSKEREDLLNQSLLKKAVPNT